VRLVNATTWKKWYLVVTRLLAPLCAALALLAVTLGYVLSGHNT
jgi:hypothetical protein